MGTWAIFIGTSFLLSGVIGMAFSTEWLHFSGEDLPT